MLSTGALVHGRYRITRPIGRGGMGAVYEAVDSRLQNAVAVKQMTVESPEADRAFEHEAMLLAGLRHAALPVVIDYFIEAGGHFLVMQFIEGEDLAGVSQRLGGACDPDDVLAWARAVLEALRYLHEHHPPIVHRDIKPANLKRTPKGEIVLLDFGLAKGRRPNLPKDGADHSFYGYTLRYAPPEQIEWRGTEPRSDLYALGATLFHLLTGIPPPPAPDRLAAVRSGRPDPLPDPHVVNPRVGEVFGRVVVRAMALEPSERFASSAAMRAALPGDGAEGVARRPRTPHGRVPMPRRVDAAMPSQVEVGRQTDLLVQVRFAGSPLLGLEDWPTRRRPPRIEQASEPLEVSHPTDPATGELLSARLRVKVVAPDFRVQGQSDLLIDVPPDDYSKRLAFLLTPMRPGYCRVNVEVCGPDEVFLGTVPVETEATAAAVTEPSLQVVTLALGVRARRVAEAALRGDDIGHLGVLAPLLLADGDEFGRGTAATVPRSAGSGEASTAPMVPRPPLAAARSAAPGEDPSTRLPSHAPPDAHGAAFHSRGAAAAPIEAPPPVAAAPAGQDSREPFTPPAAAVPAPPASMASPADVRQPPQPWEPLREDTAAVVRAREERPRRSVLRRLIVASPLGAAAVIAGVFVWNQHLVMPPPADVPPGPAPAADVPPGPAPAVGVPPGPGPATAQPAPATAVTSGDYSASAPGPPPVRRPSPGGRSSGGPIPASGGSPGVVLPPGIEPMPMPATPRIGPDVQAKKEIAETLKAYTDAYKSLDLDAIRRVFPGMPPGLTRQLRDVKSIVTCTLGEVEYIELNPEAGSATIDAPWTLVQEMNVGRRQESETIARIRMSRPAPGADWRIEAVSHRPK